MALRPSEPDWNPEEVTSHGATSQAVKELHHPDALVMLGKMARSLADCHAKIDELAGNWTNERRARARQRARERRREVVTYAGIIGVIQAVLAALHQLGVLK